MIAPRIRVRNSAMKSEDALGMRTHMPPHVLSDPPDMEIFTRSREPPGNNFSDTRIRGSRGAFARASELSLAADVP